MRKPHSELHRIVFKLPGDIGRVDFDRLGPLSRHIERRVPADGDVGCAVKAESDPVRGPRYQEGQRYVVLGRVSAILGGGYAYPAQLP